MPQNCLKKYGNLQEDGLINSLHDFPGTKHHSHTACWLERYAMLHELPFWGDTGKHLTAAGIDSARARWLQDIVYGLNDQGVFKREHTEKERAEAVAAINKTEKAMRNLIRERIIAAEALASKPNVCSMIETELMELVTA